MRAYVISDNEYRVAKVGITENSASRRIREHMGLAAHSYHVVCETGHLDASDARMVEAHIIEWANRQGYCRAFGRETFFCDAASVADELCRFLHERGFKEAIPKEITNSKKFQEALERDTLEKELAAAGELVRDLEGELAGQHAAFGAAQERLKGAQVALAKANEKPDHFGVEIGWTVVIAAVVTTFFLSDWGGGLVVLLLGGFLWVIVESNFSDIRPRAKEKAREYRDNCASETQRIQSEILSLRQEIASERDKIADGIASAQSCESEDDPSFTLCYCGQLVPIPDEVMGKSVCHRCGSWIEYK